MPTPEECFAIHEHDACLAAGCTRFLVHPDVFCVVDGECRATNDLGLCFLQDEKAGGNFTRQAFIRGFEAEGPYVIGVNDTSPIHGWVKCTEEIAQDVPGCCCLFTGEPWEVCAGIAPYPVR